MRLNKRWHVHWYWSRHEWFVWRSSRFNGGGYGWGASPYTYWKIGPIFVKRYF